MDQDNINDLMRQIDTAWAAVKEQLEDLKAYPAVIIEANDWLATVILRAAQLNAELANKISTEVLIP